MNSVTIRGVTYRSQRAAAAALGTSDGTIYDALMRGTLDNIGLGRGGNNRKPCTYLGTTYPSRIAMAKALGVKIDVVYKMLKPVKYGS